jgi:hypothetical protein
MNERQKTIKIFTTKNQADCQLRNWQTAGPDQDDFEYFINKSVSFGWDQAMRITQFLLSDNAGASAKAICRQAISIDCVPDQITGKPAHPHDPGDLKRCLICLDETGIDINIMKGASKEWSRLVTFWDQIRAVYEEESACDTGTGKTCGFMHCVIRGEV